MDRNSSDEDLKKERKVALRKESVDRNLNKKDLVAFGDVSLSARRAWIEIALAQLDEPDNSRRSPQGERG